MFPQNLIILLVACLPLLIVNHIHSRPVSKDDVPLGSVSGSVHCINCTHNQPSPSQGYPIYGAPPPPPIPPVAGYPSVGAPPPPWPVQGNCPPGYAPACCSFPPPIPHGGYAPPNPFTLPSPYGYVPIEGYSCVTTTPSGLLSIVLLLFLFVNYNYVQF